MTYPHRLFLGRWEGDGQHSGKRRRMHNGRLRRLPNRGMLLRKAKTDFARLDWYFTTEAGLRELVRRIFDQHENR